MPPFAHPQVLMDARSRTTILGPATGIALLEQGADRQVRPGGHCLFAGQAKPEAVLPHPHVLGRQLPAFGNASLKPI
jgi:hypothetical protein